jgi:hypothetical protein
MPLPYRSNPLLQTIPDPTSLTGTAPGGYGSPDNLPSPALDALQQLGSASPSSGMVANPYRMSEVTNPDVAQNPAISGLQMAGPSVAKPLSRQPMWPPTQTVPEG